MWEPGPGQIGRLLIIVGLVLVGAGALFLMLGRFGLFRLPGDLVWEGRHGRVYIPITSCVILSVVLSLVFWLIHWFRR